MGGLNLYITARCALFVVLLLFPKKMGGVDSIDSFLERPILGTSFENIERERERERKRA